MLKDVEIDLNKIIPVVDTAIKKIKKTNPDFIAHRIDNDQFDSLIEKMQSRIKKYGIKKESPEGNLNSSQKYWLYSPGSNASEWENFYNHKVMAIGWDELGDLRAYSNKEEIAERLREIHKSTGSKKNDANANYDFAHVLSVGDIVIAKKGRQEYLGYGIVISDYFFEEDDQEYKSRRKVDWKKKRQLEI